MWLNNKMGIYAKNSGLSFAYSGIKVKIKGLTPEQRSMSKSDFFVLERAVEICLRYLLGYNFTAVTR